MSSISVLVHLLLLLQIYSVSAVRTNPSDLSALLNIKNELPTLSKTWKGSDPCGTNWVGVKCVNDRVVSISLGNLNLEGKLHADVSTLFELRTLDLSSNPLLTGPLPPNIGNLKKLTQLILMGCDFNGQIPDSIGSLEQLTYLSLNLNQFTGTIPASIGLLSKLYWFDISSNQIVGELPVSTDSSPGLDMLFQARHFYFGKNKLSGEIPEKLFSSNMTSLKHVLFDENQFTGKIPISIGLVTNLTVLRLDRNRLTGHIPSSLNNLTHLKELNLANNKLVGNLPNLTSLTSLYTLDVSNNPLTVSTIPSWISSLTSLSTLRMEEIQLEGPVPTSIFSPPLLETVYLKFNLINATLDLGTNYSHKLVFVDLRDNLITGYKSVSKEGIDIMLASNQVCQDPANRLGEICNAVQPLSTYDTIPKHCLHNCSQGREWNQDCKCVYPLEGVFTLTSPSFSAFSNTSYFEKFLEELMAFFNNGKYPVASVGIRNISEDQADYRLFISLMIFPLSKDRFNQTEMNSVNSAFSTQTYKPPERFGPYIFNAYSYNEFPGIGGSKSVSTGVIIGVVVSVVVLLLLLAIAGIYAFRQKRRAERAKYLINPFVKWDASKTNIDAPQLMGAKAFTFEELSKYTNNFSTANDIGGGGYGQVYKGVLPSGQSVAIKRAKKGSKQGGLEFKTEIELLSRVHHKNVVKLLGFCFDQSEHILVYEYIPNGSLRDGLRGKNGVQLDWTKRLQIALGSGKGLAYLHELADPPIIHRDIKSNNILLDENLTAIVADFGLSKIVGDPEKVHVTKEVKGTLGYLDPEYCMTNHLTEKSDVYGFGVVMLELLTGKSPIDGERYVVEEIKNKMNKSRHLYDLQELLDMAIIQNSRNLKGFEKYVDVALQCVEPEGINRPSMSEVVHEIAKCL